MTNVRITIEIGTHKYGGIYDNVERLIPGELGKVIEATVDRHLGREMPAPLPVALEQ